jgi:hypothetical protein
MVLAERKCSFTRKKALDALDKVKDAIDKDDLQAIGRLNTVAEHHIDAVQRILHSDDGKKGEE